jgi:hypothetical protein
VVFFFFFFFQGEAGGLRARQGPIELTQTRGRPLLVGNSVFTRTLLLTCWRKSVIDTIILLEDSADSGLGLSRLSVRF